MNTTRSKPPPRRPLLVRVREWALLVVGFAGLGWERFVADEPRLLWVTIWLGFIGGPALVLQEKVLRPLITRALPPPEPTDDEETEP